MPRGNTMMGFPSAQPILCSLRLLSASGLFAVLAVASPAPAQAPTADPAAKKTLTDAASALGMVRGLNRALDVVNMFEFTASGTMADPHGGGDTKVSRITAGYDFVIPAARIDIERAASDGTTTRHIAVAAGQLSWDESLPGIFLRAASTSAADRL